MAGNRRKRKQQQQQQQRATPRNPAQTQSRRRRKRGGNGQKIKGSGMYTIPKGTFESIGGALGAAAGRGLASFTGVGDYVFNDIVHTPALPQRNHSNIWRITNCEYIGEFLVPAAPTAFNLNSYPLNPGDASTFPWLSRVARLYQKYKFEQLIFEFRSNTSDYAASGPLGTVVFSPVYNVLADTPQTKQQMEAFAHAVSTKPSNSVMCGVECDEREDNIRWYYVRAPSAEATQFTDPGRFLAASQGLPSSSGNSLGELWVHYTIKFDEPILTTVQANQVYARQRTNTNTAGLLGNADCFAGVRVVSNALTSQSVKDSVIPETAASFAEVIVSNGRPNVPYFAAVDSSVTANARWWFAAAGTYLIEYKVTFYTGFVSVTTDQPLYSASLVPGYPTGTNLAMSEYTAAKQAGDGDVWAGLFTLTAGGSGVGVDFRINPSLNATGGSAVILDGTACAWVRVTRI